MANIGTDIREVDYYKSLYMQERARNKEVEASLRVYVSENKVMNAMINTLLAKVARLEQELRA